MMIEVNDQERELLVRVLEASRSETSVEIHHANNYQTRDSLREERKTLDDLIAKLGAVTHAVQ